MEPKSFLRVLSLIHISLFSGLLLFAIFAYFQNGGFTAAMNQEDLFIYIVPTVAATGYFVSQYLFRKLLSGIKKDEKLKSKMGKYQTALLIQYALIEGPAFLALFAYYGTGNALYLVIAISLLAYLFTKKPTAAKLIKDVPLTLEEHKQFDILRN